MLGCKGTTIYTFDKPFEEMIPHGWYVVREENGCQTLLCPLGHPAQVYVVLVFPVYVVCPVCGAYGELK